MTDPRAAGPGRACPLDYRYGARALARPATLALDSLWVAGGLYGNPFALRRLQEMFGDEIGSAALIFNGDFHWFDIADEAFAEIDRGVSLHVATRGNVETELAQPQAGAGCGCAYPEWVNDAEVERSNRIIERLKRAASRSPGAVGRLAALPMYLVAEVGGLRVAVVHGDASSLAGWGFSQEALATPDGRNAAAAAFGAAGVSVFASSHTCLPVLQVLADAGVIVNNGAAGMPNFEGACYGLATRVSLRPSRLALYRTCIGPLHVESIPIDYDAQAWREAFLAQWPKGSDAYVSYYRRIVNGPRYNVHDAVRTAEHSSHPGAPDEPDSEPTRPRARSAHA